LAVASKIAARKDVRVTPDRGGGGETPRKGFNTPRGRAASRASISASDENGQARAEWISASTIYERIRTTGP